MQKWKILSTIDVSPSDWFPIIKDQVKLPNGTVVNDYYTSPLGNVVMILPITTAGNFVLIKQYKHGISEIIIELPAGFQQKGKSLEKTAVAELEEETGIKTRTSNLQFFF